MSRPIITDEPIDLPQAKPTQTNSTSGANQQIIDIQQTYKKLLDLINNTKELFKVQNIPPETLLPIFDLDNQMRSIMDEFKKSIPKSSTPIQQKMDYGTHPPEPKMDYGVNPPQPEFKNLGTAFDWIKKNKKQKSI